MGVYFADTGNNDDNENKQNKDDKKQTKITTFQLNLLKQITLCYAIVLPGRKWVFNAGYLPDSYRKSRPAFGRRADFQVAGRPGESEQGSNEPI